MKKVLLIVVLVLAALVAGGYAIYRHVLPVASAAPLDAEHARIAGRFLDLIDEGRYDEALAMTDERVRAALANGKLEEIWTALPAQLGARKSRSPLRGEAIDGQPIVTSTLEFGMLSLDARVVVDAEGKISGFRIVPTAGATPSAPAPLANNDRYRESELAVDETRRLGATLTLPAGEGPFPAVVLVHGSGPHDRDETIGPNKPFRDLAHGLAEHGIAVLRYEKRTKARPDDFASGDFTVDDETTDDAVSAVRQLRTTPHIDPARIFVAGHSLGALMAPRIAQRAPELAGLVLLAAPARRLDAIYMEQVEFLAGGDGSVSEAEREKLDAERRKADAVATLSPDSPASENLLGLPARYWIDLRGYDPVAVAQQIPQPMLVLQGGRDYQVTPVGDFALWQAAFDGSERVTLQQFAPLNHLFIAGEGAPNPQEYFVEGRVAKDAIDAIAAWIGRH